VSKRIDLGPSGEPPRRRAQPEPQPELRRDRGNETVRDRISLVFGVALIVLGLFTGFVAFTMFRSHTLNPIAGVVNYFVPSPESVFGKERIYVLLMGLDYDYDSKDNPTSKESRTDKIEAFAFDFPTKVIKSVAVPRDLDAIVDGHEDKINDAYHYGGWRNTDAVVGKVLAMQPTERGTYFDRYLTLRINASKDVINAIGGLDVPVTQAMDYDDNWGHLHIHFKPGVVHMDGDEAVSYARFRHDACSDPCRIKRQQQIEKLAIAKLKSDRFNDLTHIGALIDVIRRDVDTNLSVDEMRSLGWYFRDLNVADVHDTQVPYTSDKDLPCCGDVLVADESGIQKIVRDFLGPYQMTLPTPTADQLAAINPASISIAVLNGSGIGGLGKKLADQLRADGYVIKNVGNAESFDYDVTVLRTHSALPLVGERLRSDIGLAGATITPAPESTPSGNDVTVVIGRDYATALAASTPAPADAPKTKM
jgi:polyisoprenyl-teichoic acid--peptidoglycan teichoic acid transferase